MLKLQTKRLAQLICAERRVDLARPMLAQPTLPVAQFIDALERAGAGKHAGLIGKPAQAVHKADAVDHTAGPIVAKVLSMSDIGTQSVTGVTMLLP